MVNYVLTVTMAKIQIFHGQNDTPKFIPQSWISKCLNRPLAMGQFQGVMVIVSTPPPILEDRSVEWTVMLFSAILDKGSTPHHITVN